MSDLKVNSESCDVSCPSDALTSNTRGNSAPIDEFFIVHLGTTGATRISEARRAPAIWNLEILKEQTIASQKDQPHVWFIPTYSLANVIKVLSKKNWNTKDEGNPGQPKKRNIPIMHYT